MSTLAKRILVNLPPQMFFILQKQARKQYRSVSSLIRQSILENIEDEFDEKELALIKKGQREFREGKGKNWRDVKK